MPELYFIGLAGTFWSFVINPRLVDIPTFGRQTKILFIFNPSSLVLTESQQDIAREQMRFGKV